MAARPELPSTCLTKRDKIVYSIHADHGGVTTTMAISDRAIDVGLAVAAVLLLTSHLPMIAGPKHLLHKLPCSSAPIQVTKTDGSYQCYTWNSFKASDSHKGEYIGYSDGGGYPSACNQQRKHLRNISWVVVIVSPILLLCAVLAMTILDPSNQVSKMYQATRWPMLGFFAFLLS